MPLNKSGSKEAFKQPPVSNETLAYISGLFDGEGCVNFTQAGKQKTWVIRVMIKNTDLPVLKFVQSAFGGRIDTKETFKDNPTWKSSHCWRLDWDHAIKFLTAIDPWVRIKGDQIVTAQLWNEVRNRGNKRPTQDNIEFTQILVEQLRWLNRKCKRLNNDIEPMQKILDTIPIFQEIYHASH